MAYEKHTAKAFYRQDRCFTRMERYRRIHAAEVEREMAERKPKPGETYPITPAGEG